MRTILFLLYLAIGFILSMVALFPAPVLLIFGMKKYAHRYIYWLAKVFARNFITVAGARVEVSGLEKLPESSNICFISNHQGIADIPIIVGFIPKPIGFIAKKELKMIPILNLWITAQHCVYIDRKNPRKSILSIEKGAENIKRGFSMVIFPEGTRARSNKPGKFKQGSLKLAIQAKAIIVPVTVMNSYKLFEEYGRLRKANVKLIIHDPIYPENVTHENQKALITQLEEIVCKPLIQNQ